MNNIEKQLKEFKYKIILGSASPRRKNLLAGLGFEFECKPMNADESFPDHLKAEEIPLYLAKKKAEAFTDLQDNELLITADTIVWCDEKVLNKPEDFVEGKKMLQTLSGKIHKVFTGVFIKTTSKQHCFYDVSNVHFK